MTAGPLTNPPLIITDIPTCLETLIGDLPEPRYLGGDFKFVALDTTPDGFAFPGHARGVIGILHIASKATSAFGGNGAFVAVIHKPTHVVGDYMTGWIALPDTIKTYRGSDANNSYTAVAGLASQRKGDYSYVFMQEFNFPLFAPASNPVTIHKVTRGEFTERGPFCGAEPGVYAGAWATFRADAQTFVSDDEQPFIWNIPSLVGGGYTSPVVKDNFWNNLGPIVVTGFRDDGNFGVGSEVFGYVGDEARTARLYGQTGAYYQGYDIPVGQWTSGGPYFVFPWADGDYAPPELWFFLLEFENSYTTGRLKIYRSKWTKGGYVKPSFPFHLDANEVTVENPELNPNGYAFDHDWFTPDKLIATIGPFSGATITNPIGTPWARYQNSTMDPATTLATAFSITVQRDKSKMGVLHMIVQSPNYSYPRVNSIYEPAPYNSLWYLNSLDDGATWSTAKQISPGAIPDPKGIRVGGTASGIPTKQGLDKSVRLSIAQSGNVCLVRTNEDMMLLGNVAVSIDYTLPGGVLAVDQIPKDAGGHVGLIAVDYTGRGFGDGQQQALVFRGVQGQTSWQ